MKWSGCPLKEVAQGGVASISASAAMGAALPCDIKRERYGLPYTKTDGLLRVLISKATCLPLG